MTIRDFECWEDLLAYLNTFPTRSGRKCNWFFYSSDLVRSKLNRVGQHYRAKQGPRFLSSVAVNLDAGAEIRFFENFYELDHEGALTHALLKLSRLERAGLEATLTRYDAFFFAVNADSEKDVINDVVKKARRLAQEGNVLSLEDSSTIGFLKAVGCTPVIIGRTEHPNSYFARFP